MHRGGCSGGGVAEVQAMTISDLDIYRSAHLLLERHGADASIHAAVNAHAMLDRDDLGGQAVSLRIVKVIGGLLSTRPGTGRRCC